MRFEWRSFLLRPRPDPERTLEQFRTYTNLWLRPAAQPDSGTFRVWEGDAGPPSHSVPPHLVAKAAAALGEEAFRCVHTRLLHAYFAENQDITDSNTLRSLWRELDLPEPEFSRSSDPLFVQQTMDEHNEAIQAGVTGVPAVRMVGQDGVVIGAQPRDVYRRWIQRALGE